MSDQELDSTLVRSGRSADDAALDSPRARVMRSTPVRTGQTAVSDPEALARLGALVRLLRAERDMGVSELARRSMCARSTVQRLEAGKLRPRPSLLGYVAWGLDPDHSKLIREALITAAGGRQVLAEDGNWGGHRARRANQAMCAGKIPLPSDLQKRIALHQQASACWAQAQRILARPGALDNARLLDLAIAYMDKSRTLRAEAGGVIGLGWGGRRVLYGIS